MPAILIDALPVGGPFAAVQVHAGKFPVDPRLLPAIRLFLGNLVQAASTGGLTGDVFLQHQYLPNAKDEFMSHLQAWTPLSGLGVWPDRPPPELWKTADMFRMAKGEDVPLMYRVLQVNGGPQSGAEAWDTLLGSGMVMELVHSGLIDSLLNAYKAIYLPDIKTPNLRIFPFYVPLLDVNSVRDRPAEELSKWLGGVRLYIRESPEDKSILLLSDLAIEPLLVKAGAREAGKGRWALE
jgi:hypothetical protein